MGKCLFVLLVICCFFSCAIRGCAKKQIKVLIIDGQNNHVVWPKSTIMMKQYLEETNKFKVDVARTQFLNRSEVFKKWLPFANVPQGIEGEPKRDSSFNPDFSKYDVVISNFGWQAASWPKKTKAKFENYIKNGGGFVTVHAANNSFPKWKAYNNIIGVGGWGGRNEKDGPYVYVDKNNNIIRDNTSGLAGKHGKKEAFQVAILNTDHPITKGLPPVWMHATDECYALLRGGC